MRMNLKNASASTVEQEFDTVIPSQTWTHVVYVKEGTGANQVKCYINGVVESSTFQIDFTLTNSNPRIYVACNRAANNYHKGKISQCKLYKNKGLTAAEIKQNFDALKGRYGL